MSTARSIELLTLSYRGDFAVCQLLCDSMDRFVPDDVAHRLAVPRDDLTLFAPLATERRRLVAQEDLLPGWFRRAPRWVMDLTRLRRNLYLTPFSLPVRGWIAQQIMKIAAAAASDADAVVHIDSDNAFIRPFSPAAILAEDGRVRIFRDPNPAGLAGHAAWQKAAGQLLGLPASPFYGGEYIDQLVVWRPDVVRGLIDRLETVSGRDWILTLARTPHFAEYVLYGVYADQVLGWEAAGLVPQAFSLSHSMWTDTLGEDAAALDAFVAALEPQHLSCLLQSTLSQDIARRREIFERVAAAAAHQDGRGAR